MNQSAKIIQSDRAQFTANKMHNKVVENRIYLASLISRLYYSHIRRQVINDFDHDKFWPMPYKITEYIYIISND
jgi:hypothetical protein